MSERWRCFEKENAVANDTKSAMARSEWRDLNPRRMASSPPRFAGTGESCHQEAAGPAPFVQKTKGTLVRPLCFLVGVAGLEPAASWSRSSSGADGWKG